MLDRSDQFKFSLSGIFDRKSERCVKTTLEVLNAKEGLMRAPRFLVFSRGKKQLQTIRSAQSNWLRQRFAFWQSIEVISPCFLARNGRIS